MGGGVSIFHVLLERQPAVTQRSQHIKGLYMYACTQTAHSRKHVVNVALIHYIQRCDLSWFETLVYSATKQRKKMKLYMIGIIPKCKNQFFYMNTLTFAQNICTWIGTFVDSNQSKWYGTYWCVIQRNGIHYWSHYWFSPQGGQRWGSPALQVVMGARRRNWDTTYNVNDCDTDTMTTAARINILYRFWEH